MAQDAAAARRRFIAGDPLRGIAAMLVVGFHLAVATSTTRGTMAGDGAFGRTANELFAVLSIGLYIFFVLSGYLLARPFVAALAARRDLPDPRRYVRHRLLRIVPAFWVVALVTVALVGTDAGSIGQIVALFAFAQAWNPGPVNDVIPQTWTLGVELFFYLLLPLAAAALVVVGARRWAPRRVLLAVGVLAALLFLASLGLRATGWNEDGFFYRFPVNLWAFAPGILLAVAAVAVEGRRLAGPVWRVLPAALVLLAAGAYLAASRPGTSETLERPLLYAVFGGALVAAPLVRQWRDGGAWRVLDNRVMHWLGERSYSIYLVHAGVIWLVARHVVTGVDGAWAALGVASAVALAATFALSELLHRLVERPALRLKDARLADALMLRRPARNEA